MARAAPPHSHVEGEDEQGVQQNIADGADGDREHAGLGKALRVDKGVEPQGQLDKNGAQRVQPHIVPGVRDGVFTGAEEEKQVLSKQLDDAGE